VDTPHWKGYAIEIAALDALRRFLTPYVFPRSFAMYDILIALVFIALLAIPAIVASLPRRDSDDEDK
jgi:hypothetical protein